MKCVIFEFIVLEELTLKVFLAQQKVHIPQR
jgi:hypothetical protein